MQPGNLQHRDELGIGTPKTKLDVSSREGESEELNGISGDDRTRELDGTSRGDITREQDRTG